MEDEINVLLDPEQELIALINKDNSAVNGKPPLTLDDVELSDPVSVQYAGRNTRVTLIAKATSRYTGVKEVFYNRLALSDLGYVGLLTEEPLTLKKMFEMISSKKGISMLVDDFEPIVIPVLEAGESLKINLVAKPTAVKWYGQTQVDYAFSVPPGLDLLHRLIHVILPTQGYLT